jgi:hypothetical protein
MAKKELLQIDRNSFYQKEVGFELPDSDLRFKKRAIRQKRAPFHKIANPPLKFNGAPAVKQESKLIYYSLDYTALPKTDHHGSIWQTTFFHLRDSRDLIREEIRSGNAEIRSVGNKELKIFNALATAVKQGIRVKAGKLILKETGFTEAECIQEVVLKVAKAKRGIPYNYNFNFLSFKKLSCVEFIWYCYKSLYILHNVKRETLHYFNLLKTRVIAPDMFLKSDFFKIVYTTYKDDGIQSTNINSAAYRGELLQSLKKNTLIHGNSSYTCCYVR